MKFIIDEKVCGDHKLSVTEMLVCLAVRNADNFDNIISNLINRQVLVNFGGKFMITQHWNDVIDEILLDSSDDTEAESYMKRLTNLAEKMRECFPQGKMHGTPYYYRCNNREVILKLKKFFIQYGNYSDEDIIDATKRFVASYQGNYRYMPLIKYFIMKNKTVKDEDGTSHIQEVSELASYLENKGKEEEVVITSDDWLVSVRN